MSTVDYFLKEDSKEINANIEGYVEQIGAREILGWVINRENEPIALSLRIEDKVYSVTPLWSERADVAASLGEDFIESGFIITIPDEIASLINDDQDNGSSIGIMANGVLLANTQEVEKSIKKAARLSGKEVRTIESQGVIEKCDQFIITGWGLVNEEIENSIALLCNGKPVECSVIRKERQDVAEALGVDESESIQFGFELEIPGYIWEDVPEDEACQLQIYDRFFNLVSNPIELSREKAADWVSEIGRMSESQNKQYLALLVLEHMRYGQFSSLLDKETALFVQNIARQMQLEDFVFVGDTLEQHETEEAITEDANTLIFWKALKRLNARLINREEEPVFEQVKAVHDELRGEYRHRYILSVIPLLCRQNEFFQLRLLADFASLFHLDHSNNVWEMSLSIAPLVADRHVGRSSDLLYRLAKQLDSGWLNTECVRFAVTYVQKLEAEGDIDLITAEKFRYAFIALLDGFKGNWFSRLHDRELILAMTALLADLERYTDYHKRDMVAAAIRHYGLCPTFWQCLAEQGNVFLDHEITRAQAMWFKLRNALEHRDFSTSERLEELREAIAYFQHKHNPDALIVLRELVTNSLPNFNKDLSSIGKVLLEELLFSDPTEALRIAAFPLAGENTLQTHFPETQEGIFKTLRQLSECDKSSVYDLQNSAAASLLAAQAAADKQDIAALKDALIQTNAKAIALSDWQGQFLGVDLLASVYQLAFDTPGLDEGAYLPRLAEFIHKAKDNAAATWYLPNPVCSALSRLNGIAADSMLRGFLREIQNVLRHKFGDRHDELFMPVAKPTLSIAGKGWPYDTLVVIYSCRKYLESRVAAIRTTWLQDLQDRGIPYVILVGDGEDTLEDDVLALNVSDKYEDLPKKTLKLFEWVYTNTDAQYVLKIDDDCYLDVARFFETLSYRKHFYYGRVLRRGIGSMDRAWHQSKSHTHHGQKAIDKSPEPAIYADGGGGYSLSRLAIMELLKAKKTDAGKRLIACSFMEDKLVGDLLALSHILPSNEDYESYQRRRTFGEAMPVAMWENTFFPSQITPTKVVHLDTERHLALTHENIASKALWPKKLWPTCDKPTISLNSNQLELLTPLEKTIELLRHTLFVVSVVRNEMIMLPHFLDHYRALGVKGFIFVDNCSDDGSREYLFEQPDVILYSADTEYKYSNYGVSWQQAVLGNLCLGKWVLLADADELLVFPGCENRLLTEFIDEVEAEGADAVWTDMIDMYPRGDLDDADFKQQSPFEAAPWFDNPATVPWLLGSGWFSNMAGSVNHLRHRSIPDAVPHDFVSQKIALIRYQPWVRLSQGIHYAANLNISTRTAYFAHFKYHAGFKEKIRVEIQRAQHFNNAAEYRRYTVMIAEGKGGFFKKGVSVKHDGSHSFQRKRSKQKAIS
ncbi:glycosyltransferase family 2 protein [Methylobacter luteus]|uniref:glycosyltransferase family 2 protein n=1 Tax=Methylobacter luteus TaxID=415 RepID=UPI00041708A0|nr:glycosyltransferase family 2 protein [Methylobacter luteus]